MIGHPSQDIRSAIERWSPWRISRYLGVESLVRQCSCLSSPCFTARDCIATQSSREFVVLYQLQLAFCLPRWRCHVPAQFPLVFRQLGFNVSRLHRLFDHVFAVTPEEVVDGL